MWQYTPRVAVVRGLRTPFAKSGTHYAHLSALDLGKLVVAELVQRSGIDPNTIQEVVFGKGSTQGQAFVFVLDASISVARGTSARLQLRVDGRTPVRYRLTALPFPGSNQPNERQPP